MHLEADRVRLEAETERLKKLKDKILPVARNPAAETQIGDFPSMKKCLAAVRAFSEISEIEIDLPYKVIGLTRSNHIFGCQRYITGTRGTFFQAFVTPR